MSTPDSAQPDLVPLDDRKEFAPVEALAHATRQLGLYGTGHPIAEAAVREAWRELTAVAERHDIAFRVEEAGPPLEPGAARARAATCSGSTRHSEIA